MATIESSPLPPPGFRGRLAKITEADRAELMAQANAVIDFYLNGPGSFTPDGPRKPAIDEPGYDSTIQDLNNFRNSLIAAKQFADDPDHILDSVLELIKATAGQVERAMRDRATTGPDVKDSISHASPDTIDPLNNAHVPAPLPIPDVPQDPVHGSVSGQPITLQALNAPEVSGWGSSPSPVPSQNSRRLWLPDFVTPTLAQAGSPSALTFAPSDPNASASLFTRLLSAGPDALLVADDAAGPLQPDATSDAAGNGPERFLARRTYDPSQSSPFTAQPAPSQPAPDGSLSLNDAYLEYLKRLNAG